MQKFRLAPLARNHYEISLKCLVFSSRSYQECYKDKDISAPTKYLIDQQDIEISKNFTCKGRNFYRLTRNSLQIFNLEIKIIS